LLYQTRKYSIWEFKITYVMGDNVFVSWWDKTDGKDQSLMRISQDGGQTFGEAILLTAISTSSSS
jgi:hypothetical protein